MSDWLAERVATLGGFFRLVVTRSGQAPVDVTIVRGAPTILGQYSNGDPFGDGAFTATFPRITMFDDMQSPEFAPWLAEDASVDLYWVPASEHTGGPIINPLTNQPDILASHLGGQQMRVWEGFISSLDFDSEGAEGEVQIQCQGALYQADCYNEKPFFPPRPQTMESLIGGVFDKARRPHLRTMPMQIQYPFGWSLRVPAHSGSPSIYTPDALPGTLWSGYTTRNTGSWNHSLTEFVQDLLSVMLTQDNSGAVPGNQWTLQHRRYAAGGPPGRTPILTVRDRYRPADLSVWLGTPGVKAQLSRDATQAGNIIYGDGTSIDGTVWRNAVISNDGSRTDYLPLAADPQVWPSTTNNRQFSGNGFVREVYLKYGTGFNQDDAITSAAKTLGRDSDPGYAGTITLSIDPTAALPRWLIRAGMTINLKGFLGTGQTGMNFHIAEVEVDPEAGTVTLKVDTRYRDLLNLEESLSRTRDTLTPAKLLQVNRASVVIQDILAPWDYSAGAGYVPKTSKAFHDYDAPSDAFPYSNWAIHHPPFLNPNFYVKVNAHSGTRKGRWAGPIPILTSEKGSIRRSEFACYDKYGKLVKIPFHVSLYYYNVTAAAMPYDAGGPSPFITGAFESINTATGQPWPPGNHLAPDPSLIIAWGNYQQRAGFSPGRETDGGAPTGLSVDEGSWSYDNTFHQEFKGNPKPQHFTASTITIYAMFYAEGPGGGPYSEPVYFMGRLFRDVPGT